jgi:hypothetical protein
MNKIVDRIHTRYGHWWTLKKVHITSQYLIGDDWHNNNRRTSANHYVCLLCDATKPA